MVKFKDGFKGWEQQSLQERDTWILEAKPILRFVRNQNETEANTQKAFCCG